MCFCRFICEERAANLLLFSLTDVWRIRDSLETVEGEKSLDFCFFLLALHLVALKRTSLNEINGSLLACGESHQTCRGHIRVTLKHQKKETRNYIWPQLTLGLFLISNIFMETQFPFKFIKKARYKLKKVRIVRWKSCNYLLFYYSVAETAFHIKHL